MRQWQAFNAICDHLRIGLLGGQPVGRPRRPSWEAVIEASSWHYVAPTLAWCLNDKPLIPDDVRDYFAGILALNTTRNESIADGLARIVAALNAVDVEPTLLKGAAHLVEGLYPAPGLRLLGDVDLLIPQERAKDAAASLLDIGFVVPATSLPENHHHLPGMRDPDSGLYVELHTRIEEHAEHAIAPTDWFQERARPALFRGLRVRLAEPTRSVGHNIVHSQLNGRVRSSARVHLRYMVDLALIRLQHEQAIDWNELDRRFSKAGCGHVLADYLALGEAFFGQPMPRLGTAPHPLVLMRCRLSEQVKRVARWSAITTMAFHYMAARCRNPGGLLDLFRSKTWPRRLRRVREALKRPS